MVVVKRGNGQFMLGEDLKMRLFKQTLPMGQPQIWLFKPNFT